MKKKKERPKKLTKLKLNRCFCCNRELYQETFKVVKGIGNDRLLLACPTCHFFSFKLDQEVRKLYE